MYTYDKNDVLTALNAVIRRHGADTTYRLRDQEYYESARDCRYVDESGNGCCLVGTVLVEEFKVDPGFFLDDDLNNLNSPAISGQPGVEDLIDDEGWDILHAVQLDQDLGRTWGDAYKNALKGDLGADL